MTQPPKVWFWYKLYCWGTAALHVVWLWGCIYLKYKEGTVAQEAYLRGIDLPPYFITLAAALFAAQAIGFGIGFLWLPTVKPSRQAWSMHFTGLVIGALSCVMAPFAIPLLIAFNKPAVKQWFELGGIEPN